MRLQAKRESANDLTPQRRRLERTRRSRAPTRGSLKRERNGEAEFWRVAGVAYGAVIGAFLHLVIHAVAAWRVGWRPGPSLAWRHPDVKKVWQLLLPRTVGQSVTQIDQFVNVPFFGSQMNQTNLNTLILILLLLFLHHLLSRDLEL